MLERKIPSRILARHPLASSGLAPVVLLLSIMAGGGVAGCATSSPASPDGMAPLDPLQVRHGKACLGRHDSLFLHRLCDFVAQSGNPDETGHRGRGEGKHSAGDRTNRAHRTALRLPAAPAPASQTKGCGYGPAVCYPVTFPFTFLLPNVTPSLSSLGGSHT